MTRRAAPRRGARLVAAAAALLAAAEAAAQAPQRVLPAGVDPARLPQQAPSPPPPPAAATPEPAIPTQPGIGPPPGAEQLRFRLTDLVIEGVTAYRPEQLRPLYARYLGQEISVADLFAISEAITERYRADGYLISRALVPAQRIEAGTARVQVIEGFVSEVTVEPEDKVLQRRAERAVASSRPLTLSRLERSLLLLNDLPGVTAQGVIEPAPGGPVGAARLAVTAERRRVWEGFVALDNRGSRYVGPWQATVGGGVSSVLTAYDRLAFRAIGASPLRELRFLELGYEAPVGPDGWSLFGTAYLSRSEPGFTLAALDTKGKSEGFSIGAAYPIIRTRAENLRASFAFTPYNSDNALLGRRDLAPGYEDDMRPVRLGLTYDLADRWAGLNYLFVELSRGLDALGASAENRPNPSRPGARTTFTRLRFEANRLQPLEWITPGLGLFLAAQGQWAFGAPLVAFEQFGLGGARFGRGYDPAEISGDNGIAGLVELQYSLGFEPGMYTFDRTLTLQPYVFYDAGIVTNAKTEFPSQSLASTGVGIRLWLGDAFAAALELAKPLTRNVATEVLAGGPGNDPRLYFSTVLRF
jgi:hemolysin activation/secretion protein